MRDSQAAFDVRHYDLDLEIDPENRWLRGRLIVRVRAIAPLFCIDLDLDDRLEVSDVRLVQPDDGRDQELPFRHESRRLVVDLPVVTAPGMDVSVEISYQGSPRESVHPPFDGGFTWQRTANGEHWVGVSVQLGAGLWWPCKEHPSDKPEDGALLHFTVPADLVVVSNGRLTSVETLPDGRRTWHWHVSYPINSYNVTFNAAPFVELKADYRGVDGKIIPFSYFVLPQYLNEARRVLPEFVDHLAFLEKTFGPYPFRSDKYSIVLSPYLGMEHQTAISYGPGFDERRMGFLWIALHEAAHEWWGNLVSASDWRDFWIHEGFAKYSEALYAGHLHGMAAYHEYLARFVRPGIANDFELAPTRSLPLHDMIFTGSGRNRSRRDPYDKGAMVLHTLRYLLGEDTFFELLRIHAYPDPSIRDGCRVRLESSDDFARRVETTAGRDFSWFFHAYLRQPLLPHLAVSRHADVLALKWDLPGDLAFPMPVDVSIDGVLRRVEMPGGKASILVPTGACVIIDPDWWVLRDECPEPDRFGRLGVPHARLDPGTTDRC